MRKLILPLILLAILLTPLTVEAQTLNDLRANLNRLQAQANENQRARNIKQSEINATNNRIATLGREITNTIIEIERAKNDIERFNNEIKQKEEQTKELAKFMQISSGESFFLEFIFGAESLQDLIYRISITNQLASHNRQLIAEMNDLIEQLNRRQAQLVTLQERLQVDQAEAQRLLVSLQGERAKLDGYYRDIQADIRVARNTIRTYERLGCRPNQTLQSCMAGTIPPSTGQFMRPFVNGCVTSEWGNRWGSFHFGIDLACNRTATIFPVAPGIVAATFFDPAGGNTVVIHHMVNGRRYTSAYLHLASMSVSQGQTVSTSTPIGIIGTTGWNTTGIHLHLSIARCHRFVDCVSHSQWTSAQVNPRTYIQFPGLLQRWSSR